jgi:hypothetical protein
VDLAHGSRVVDRRFADDRALMRPFSNDDAMGYMLKLGYLIFIAEKEIVRDK